MSVEKLLEELNRDELIKKRMLMLFEEHIDEWIITFLRKNDCLLINDTFRFLFGHALNNLAKYNLNEINKAPTRRNIEKEKSNILYYTENTIFTLQDEIKMFMPCIKWLFLLLCSYEKYLNEKGK